MAISSCTITSSLLSPSTKIILCDSVIVGLKRSVTVKPNANSTAVVQGQTQSFENPTYSIPRVALTQSASTLTYADVLTIAKINYDGTNAPTLSVVYGKPGATRSLVASDGSTTNIKVLLKDATFPIDVSDTVGGYIPKLALNFVETG